MIAFKKFGGSLADADLTTNYTSDGRVRRLRGSGKTPPFRTRSRSEPPVPLLVPYLSFVMPAFACGRRIDPRQACSVASRRAADVNRLGAINRNRREDPVRHDCRTIAEIASSRDESKTKTVTLTYTVTVNYTGPGGGVLIAPDGELSSAYKPGSTKQIELRSDPASDDAYNQLWLIKRFPMRVQVVRSRLKSTLEPVWAGHTGLNATDQDDKFAALKLNRTAAVNWATGWLTITEADRREISGHNYVLEAAGAAAKLLPTDASRAAQLNAQSDLIAAQQRFVRCKADHSQCSK